MGKLRKRDSRKKFLFLALFLGMLLFLGGVQWAYRAGYRITVTASMPKGLYQLQPIRNPIGRETIVNVCPPDTPVSRLGRKRHYLASGDCPGNFIPMIKPVAAVAGDQVVVKPTGLSVNGRLLPRSASLKQDSQGRFLPLYPTGSYTVGKRELWLISSHSGHSFDSRYYGPVSAGQVRAFARPVWLWP